MISEKEFIEERNNLLKNYGNLISTHSTIEIKPGWLRLLKNMFSELEETEQDDGLLIDYIGSNPTCGYGFKIFFQGGTVKAYGIIKKYEEQSKYVCEICGMPTGKSYPTTRCDRHKLFDIPKYPIDGKELKKLKKFFVKEENWWEMYGPFIDENTMLYQPDRRS